MARTAFPVVTSNVITLYYRTARARLERRFPSSHLLGIPLLHPDGVLLSFVIVLALLQRSSSELVSFLPSHLKNLHPYCGSTL